MHTGAVRNIMVGIPYPWACTDEDFVDRNAATIRRFVRPADRDVVLIIAEDRAVATVGECITRQGAVYGDVKVEARYSYMR